MNLFPKKFPNDEDGLVLKMLYKKGVNFNKRQNVEFFVAAQNEESGKRILDAITEEGISCELVQDEESQEWTVYCYIHMYLKYESFIEIQQILDELSQPFEGYSDGWGMMIEE